MREKFPYLEFFLSAFFSIWLSISPSSTRMRENTDQKNSEYGHFLRSVTLHKIKYNVIKSQIQAYQALSIVLLLLVLWLLLPLISCYFPVSFSENIKHQFQVSNYLIPWKHEKCSLLTTSPCTAGFQKFIQCLLSTSSSISGNLESCQTFMMELLWEKLNGWKQLTILAENIQPEDVWQSPKDASGFSLVNFQLGVQSLFGLAFNNDISLYINLKFKHY